MFKRFRQNGEDTGMRSWRALVPQINALEPAIEQLDDEALRGKTGELRVRLDRGAGLDDLMVEAFAVVREAARRVSGERHHDVQLLGGAALHFGWVAEMKTGEGKTLASTLPAYLNSLSGQGVHVVTANEYLAARDAEWMGRIHRWLGLRVGVLTPNQPDSSYRREQYEADITYGTSDDFIVDYLRDHEVQDQRHQRQRGHNFALVDDADSILIDRAWIDVMLARNGFDASDLYQRFAAIVGEMQPATDYEVDGEQRTVVPTEDGIEHVERALGVDNLYDGGAHNLAHHLQLALTAKELLQRDHHYVVKDGEVKCIDEHSGRVQEIGWSGGLHQAVEAKEGVAIRKRGQTTARVAVHSYYRIYDKLAAMTGTAMADAAALRTIYDLQVVAIPTNKPVARVDRLDLVYKNRDGKFDAVAADVATRHQVGQPVLVGTASVEKSEMLAERLDRRGIPHQVLNAKEHFREAEVIAQAGRLGAVTVATTMAGRGVDIKLGGNPEVLARDDLRSRGLDPDDPTSAQELRDSLHRLAAETAHEKRKVIDLGGLCVLGTERHESRRLDDQLRGRAGRQGEPGESRFYLSLDDDLVRPIAGAVAARIVETYPDDQPLDSKLVTRTIERRQSSLTQWRAEQSERHVRYDEVEDQQRETIYALRNQALATKRQMEKLTRAAVESDPDAVPPGLRPTILEKYLPDVLRAAVETHCPRADRKEWDLEALHAEIRSIYRSTLGTEQLAMAASKKALHGLLLEDALGRYERREKELTPWVTRIVECRVMLRVLDERWLTHLEEMAALRDGISWRRLAETDPLHAWQQEGYELFDKMMRSIARDVVRFAMTVTVRVDRKPTSR
jgi:preprotein translocase subunit SecA